MSNCSFPLFKVTGTFCFRLSFSSRAKTEIFLLLLTNVIFAEAPSTREFAILQLRPTLDFSVFFPFYISILCITCGGQELYLRFFFGLRHNAGHSYCISAILHILRVLNCKIAQLKLFFAAKSYNCFRSWSVKVTSPRFVLVKSQTNPVRCQRFYYPQDVTIKLCVANLILLAMTVTPRQAGLPTSCRPLKMSQKRGQRRPVLTAVGQHQKKLLIFSNPIPETGCALMYNPKSLQSQGFLHFLVNFLCAVYI